MIETSTYEIKLPQFEGPFDLLLFFIERDELDIYDIPIARITSDFLGYMHEMKALNIDLASEFILVAATLMRIKAKMLLPRKEIDEQGNEIDPRQDLVQALLEYKRYKEVVEQMQDLETQRRLMHPRGLDAKELRSMAESVEQDTDLGDLTLYKLMRVFQRVLGRLEERRETLAHQRREPPPALV
jgi:segregation and condensation protein A